ncbi:MAG: 50S ribosomal protein L21 [Simkaniaceae bacterium]|nr:50S ribosomal protein L21 [Simkaniaceae bacterium]
MYAIIESGSKQYKVAKGDVIDVELLHKEPNEKVSFESVMMVNNGNDVKVGTPHVTGCIVHGEVLGMEKGPKVISYKYKRRNNSRVKKGHRQKYSRVRILEIEEGK